MSDQNNQPHELAKLDEKALSQYVDELIKEKNSPYVTDANRAEVKEQLMQDVADAINQKLIDKLTDDQVEELNVLLDKDATDEELSGFFHSLIPNIPELITQVFVDFRSGYLSVMYKEEDNAQDLTPAPLDSMDSNFMPPPPPPAPVKLQGDMLQKADEKNWN